MKDIRHFKRPFTIPRNTVRRDRVMRHLIGNIFQESSNPPYLNVFKNTFSYDLEFIYDSPGHYRLVSAAGEFTENETTVSIGQSNSGGAERVAFTNIVSENEIEVITREFGNSEVDGTLTGQLFEIKVYTL